MMCNKRIRFLLVLMILGLVVSCATTGNTGNQTGSSGSSDDAYSYFTVPERSDKVILTIYKEYTFPSKRKLSEDENTLMALGFLLGMQYCSQYASAGDTLTVAFIYDNNTAKTFSCSYKDYKLYEEEKIDTDRFWERLTIQDINF